MARNPLMCRSALRRGFALPDLLAVCVCAGMLVSVLLPLSSRADDTSNKNGEAPAPKTWPARDVALRDGTQLKHIHKAFLIFAAEFDGVMPLPGLVRRLPVDGQRIPGRGEEDITLNTTANLYSLCITMNYFCPELVVSPWERNANVSIREDFGWDQYDPIRATYWDNGFKADLTDTSHTSYAHLLLTGERKAHWRDSMRPDLIHLSNRGPKDGVGDPKSYTCDDDGRWQGNIVRGDNATEWLTSMTHDDFKTTDDEGDAVADNFFARQGSDDLILTFTQKISEAGEGTIQHD